MHYCKNPRKWLQAGWLSLWLVMCPGLLGAFEISEASTRVEQDTYLLEAQIDYRFSEVALEALQNGVPLLVDVHVQVRRKGAWIWESDLVDRHYRRQLRFLPLAGAYEVTDVEGNTTKRFASRIAAVQALGEIIDWPLITQKQLKQSERYRVEMRSQLDIEALPVPLRPSAYMSSGWKLATPWHSWWLQ